MTETNEYYSFTKEEITPELLEVLMYHSVDYGFYFYSYHNHISFRTAKLENLEGIGSGDTWTPINKVEEIRLPKIKSSTHFRIAVKSHVGDSDNMFQPDYFNTLEEAIKKAKECKAGKHLKKDMTEENRKYWLSRVYVVEQVETKVSEMFHI